MNNNLYFIYQPADFFSFLLTYFLFPLFSVKCLLCLIQLLVVRRFKYDVDVGAHGIPLTNGNDDNYGSISVRARPRKNVISEDNNKNNKIKAQS